MSRQIVGLWLGGAISVEAAQMVEDAVNAAAGFATDNIGIRIELVDLANAIRAQIQKVTPDDPSEGLI